MKIIKTWTPFIFIYHLIDKKFQQNIWIYFNLWIRNMGLGSSRQREQNQIQDINVPGNDDVSNNESIRRHVNADIDVRRNNMGKNCF